jgi:hypothetical protein
MLATATPNVAVPGSSNAVRLYWVATGLFTLLFVFSIVTSLGDLETSYAVYARLGFEGWTVFFNAGAKILGLIAVLHNKSRTLKEFAYAGFLFDILLAMCAHIVNQDPDVILAIIGLVVWVFAFIMHRRVYPLDDRLSPAQ